MITRAKERESVGSKRSKDGSQRNENWINKNQNLKGSLYNEVNLIVSSNEINKIECKSGNWKIIFSMLVFSSWTGKADIEKDRIKRPVQIYGEREMDEINSELSGDNHFPLRFNLDEKISIYLYMLYVLLSYILSIPLNKKT